MNYAHLLQVEQNAGNLSDIVGNDLMFLISHIFVVKEIPFQLHHTAP